MDKKGKIKGFQYNYRELLLNIKDVTAAESMISSENKINCINWIMVVTRSGLMEILQLSSSLPDEIVENYSRGNDYVITARKALSPCGFIEFI